jgi:transcriptional regulator NrdR family protein
MSTEKPRCPYCGWIDSEVKDSRGSWRRRQCKVCKDRFSTREIVIPSVNPRHRPKLQHPTLF